MEKQLDVDLSDFFANTSRLVKDSYFREQALTRKQIVGDYLYNLNAGEQELANEFATDFKKEDVPLASTVVLIPVAAHQEAHNIKHAVDQYALQQTDKSFSVLLYPNAPADSDWDAAYGTYLEILKAQESHPHLDLRTTKPNFYDDPKIGMIRRDLWNAALLLAHYEGAFNGSGREVTGINADIDIVSQSPRNIKRIQTHAEGKQRAYESLGLPENTPGPRTIFVKHAYDSEYPHTSKAVFWYDFCYAQLRSRGSYEAGLILPFSYYASKGGFQSDATLVESKSLVRDKNHGVIPGTILETSPRRFAQRLHDTNILFKVWTENTFGANDECRTSTAPDISRDKLTHLIRRSLPASMDYFFTKTIDQYENIYTNEIQWGVRDGDTTLNEFIEALERKKRLATTVLERVIEMPHMAELVEQKSTFDTRLIGERWWNMFEKKAKLSK